MPTAQALHADNTATLLRLLPEEPGLGGWVPVQFPHADADAPAGIPGSTPAMTIRTTSAHSGCPPRRDAFAMISPMVTGIRPRSAPVAHYAPAAAFSLAGKARQGRARRGPSAAAVQRAPAPRRRARAGGSPPPACSIDSTGTTAVTQPPGSGAVALSSADWITAALISSRSRSRPAGLSLIVSSP